MQGESTGTRQPPRTPSARHPRVRLALIVGLPLICSVVLPPLAFFVGISLFLGAALHFWSPGMRPYLDKLLRVPVERPGKRRTRILITASVGVLLMSVGAVSATFRGQLRSRWNQHERQREFAQEYTTELLARARRYLSAGDLEGAEFALMDVDPIVAIDTEQQEEIDDLLHRVRRAGDSEAILAILIGLPQQEFEDFVKGVSIPDALELGHRALTGRAIDLARFQLEEAQQARRR